MDKSPEAFRTISEVAALLETPAHVLRFWETRFPQIRPVKRAGGRRYYRPNDVALLTGIKHLLHHEGMTIRGVQKVLRDQGVRHVANLVGAEFEPMDEDAEAALSAALASNFGADTSPAPEPAQATSATIVALESALRKNNTAEMGFAAQADDGADMPEIFELGLSDRLDDAPVPDASAPQGSAAGLSDFAQEMDEYMNETPVFPGFELAALPQTPPPATPQAEPAAPAQIEPADPVTFSSLGEAFMAVRALQRRALVGRKDAVQWMARARALHLRMTQNAPQDAG